MIVSHEALPVQLIIVRGVIGLAEASNRTVIAEGVETDEHRRLLLEMRCELAQGYGIAKPMPASALPGWTLDYEKRNWRAWLAGRLMFFTEAAVPLHIENTGSNSSDFRRVA